MASFVTVSGSRLILASASPRRADLLREAGILFRVAPAHIDEVVRTGESPEAYVELLAGRSHRVLTGVVLLGPADFVRAAVVSTEVTFSRLSGADIAWYVNTGEPLDKAGAYAIQGGASRFVERIDGSFSNVVGLPMELVGTWCRESGIQVS